MNRFYLMFFSLLVFSGLWVNVLGQQTSGFTIHGNFDDPTGNEWKDVSLVYETEGNIGLNGEFQKIYTLILKSQNDKPQFVIINNKSNNYLKTNSERVNVGAGCSVSLESNSYNKNITFNLVPDNLGKERDKSKFYKITFYYKGSNNDENDDKLTSHWVTMDEYNFYDTDNYYFYGDMNRWSSYRAQGEVTIKDNQGTDQTETIFKTVRHKYFTTSELDHSWKFNKVPAGSTYASAISGDITNWYYLDFKKLYDADGNLGRLCGQFKITMGDNDGPNNWGLVGGYSVDYFNQVLVANGNALKVNKHVNADDMKQNIQLEANYVQDAVLYFNPVTSEVKLTGTPHYTYVYYAIINGEPVVSDITWWELSIKDQYNYYINTVGFNGEVRNDQVEKDVTNAAAFNVHGNPSTGIYEWEEYRGENNAGVDYGNLHFTKVLRRRIPSGGTHRYPIPMNVQLHDKDVNYAQRTVHCSDIWFIKAEDVNVYFRYDNEDITKSLNWVCYNVFSKIYNKEDILSHYNYMFGGKVGINDNQPSLSGGQWGVMELITIPENDEHAGSWWRSATRLPLEFSSGTWALFGDSRGGIYPAERVKAEDDALVDVEIKGTDLYYTAATFENPAILYSHLNGTYQLSSSDIVQINAELFDPKTVNTPVPALLTDTQEVSYRFEVYYNGHLVAQNDADGKSVYGDNMNGNNAFTSLPYFDWDVNTCGKGTGYYFIVVKAYYNGVVYTAQDTYAVY